MDRSPTPSAETLASPDGSVGTVESLADSPAQHQPVAVHVQPPAASDVCRRPAAAASVAAQADIPPAVLDAAAATPVTGKKFALEIFAGCARLSGALLEAGVACGPPIDIEYGTYYDVSKDAVAHTLLGWLWSGAIWYVHLGTPCTSFSCARTTGKTVPPGAPVHFTVQVLRLLKALKGRGIVVYYSIENPMRSSLWVHPGLKAAMKDSRHVLCGACTCNWFHGCLARMCLHVSLQDLGPCFEVRFHTCAYGASYMKPTMVQTNCGALMGLQKFCTDVDVPPHTHERLEGTVTLRNPVTNVLETMWKTKLAGQYVPGLCRKWAALMAAMAPPAGIFPHKCEQWQLQPLAQQLASAARVECAPVCRPTRPQQFESGWEGAVKTWQHLEPRLRPTRKRPAAAIGAESEVV